LNIIKLAIVLIVALLVGIYGGSHLSTLIEQLQPKEKPKLAEYHAPNVLEHVKFLVLNDDLAMSDLERLNLENDFREKNLDFKIIIVKNRIEENIQNAGVLENANLIGIISPERLASLSQNAPYLIAKYTILSDKVNECFKEAQISINANSDINQLENINQKIVGIENEILPLAKLELLALKLKNITPSKIITFTNRKNGIEELLNNHIDVYFSKTKVFSNGQFEDGLASMLDHKLVNYPGLKNLKTTELKIPCNIVFFNSNFSPSLSSQIEGKLQKMIMIEKPKEMKDLLSIGALREVRIETWDALRKMLLKSLNTDLNELSENISSN
jgi:hypothetical protein